jgi:hypothetical protein
MGSALSRRLLPQGVQPQYVALTRTLALFPVLLIGAEVSPGKITIKGAQGRVAHAMARAPPWQAAR